MPAASTIASIVVALAAIAVVVRWPRPRTDRRVLERRAHGLEVLGEVVTRSAANRTAAIEDHLSRQAVAPPDTAHHPTPVTVLGPTTPGDETVVLPAARAQGRPAAPGDRPPRPLPATRGIPLPSPPAAAQVIRLGVDDLPPDDDLSETVDGFSPAAPATPSTHGRRPPAPRRLAVVGAALLVVLGGVALAVARPASDLAPNASGGRAAAASSVADPATPAPTTGGPSTEDAPPPPLTPGAVTGNTVAFDLAPPFTLDLAAGAATWVRVQTTGGDTLFEGTLAPADTTSVAATGPLQLRIGNPAGLLLAADGRLLDHPRPSGQPLTLALG